MTEASGQDLSVTLEPARERRNLAEDWQELERRAEASFFQSWGWIGTWLAELPDRFEPLCLTARAGRDLRALALLTPRQARRHGFVSANQLHLNTSGDPGLDRLAIEYNGLLLDRAGELATAGACLRYLLAQDGLWDELYLDGVERRWFDWATVGAEAPSIRKQSPCPYVDLKAPGGEDYLTGLGPNTRHQIRRSRRLYGEVRVEAATELHTAWSIWDEMKALHEAQWRRRRAQGAFENAQFEPFHRRLISDRLDTREIQLLRITGDSGTIGCLYNFAYRGRVYAYQSGFAMPDDNKLKPGLVSHHAAIELNRGLGNRYYDFLAGEARYKRSLATEANELFWVVVQRPKAAFALEKRLKQLKRAAAGSQSE